MVDVRPEADETRLPEVLAPVLHPVGTKPAATYWRRRILVLAIASTIVAVVVQVLDRGGPADPVPARPASSAAPSGEASSPSEGAVATQSPAAATSTAPTATPQVTPESAGAPQCGAADLAVTIATDASSYGSEDNPIVTLTVTNTSPRPCQANVGQNALEVRIAARDTTVWSSDACYPGGPSDVRTLEPGSVYSTSIVWRRVASGAGCPDEPRLDPGTYHVQGRAGDILSERVEIALT